MRFIRRTAIRHQTRPAAGLRQGWLRDENGAVAVEFALLALPFFTLIFAILETSIVFLTGQILDSAVQDAARKVRTGQAQTMTWDEDDFRDAVCDGLYGLFDCTVSGNRLKIKVTKFSTFQSATPTPPVGNDCDADATDEECDWTITEGYAPGVGSEIVLVEAYYKWPTLLNLPWFNLANQAGNSRMQSAVRVFRNEPF